MMLFSQDKIKKRVDYHSLKLSKLRDELENNQDFIGFMKSFIETSSQELFDVSIFFKKFYDFKVDFISFKEYIQIFVEVNTNSPTEISKELKIFFFQILLEFIVKHNSAQKLKPIELWNKNDFDDECFLAIR